MHAGDSGFGVDRERRWNDRERRLDCRSNERRRNAIPSPGGEGQDEGELQAPKAVSRFSRRDSVVQTACGNGVPWAGWIHGKKGVNP